MASVRIDGTVDIRPVRIGIVDSFVSSDSLHEFVRVCNDYWGGAGFIGMSAGSEEKAKSFGNLVGIDAITTLTPSSFPTFRALSGFTYNNFGDDGPFHVASTGFNLAALKSNALSSHTFPWGSRGGSRRHTFVKWEATHPLSDYLWATFGCPDFPDGLLDEDRFNLIELGETDSVPVVEWSRSQLGTTFSQIIDKDVYKSIGIARIRTESIEDLISFWNLRALGFDILPWPEDNSSLIENFASHWMRDRTSKLEPDQPLLYFGDDDVNVEAFLSQHDVGGRESQVKVFKYERAEMMPNWVRVAPLASTYKQSFSVDIEDTAWTFKVPLPRIDNLDFDHTTIYAGRVLADISINWHNELPDDRGTALSLPREVASDYLRGKLDLWTPTCRPNENGLRVTVDAESAFFDYPLISAIELSNYVFKSAGYDSKASEAQGYGLAIIKRLGGVGPYSTALQPSVRKVLYEASRSELGKPRNFLRQIATDHQGHWPTELQYRNFDYADWVLKYLAAQGLLLAVLRLQCLSCNNEFSISAEFIDHEVTCTLCGDTRKTALYVAGSKPEWFLKFGGDQQFYEKISEILPVLGAVSLISGIRIGLPREQHFTTGTKLTRAGRDREIDLFLALREDGHPVYIVGESKSYTDEFNLGHVENLKEIQRQFQTQGLECWILFVTLRETLSASNIELFQSAFSNVQSTRVFRRPGNLSEPIAPIILTNSDLSSSALSELNPLRKLGGARRISKLAINTCVESLGLTSTVQVADAFELKWT